MTGRRVDRPVGLHTATKKPASAGFSFNADCPADEQVQAAVNSNQGEADSAPAAPQGEAANTPAAENAVAESNSGENRVPQSRFNEVVEQRNKEREIRASYEARIREIEARQSAPAQGSIVDSEVKRLVAKLGITPEAAHEMVDSSMTIARAERGAVEQKLQQYELSRWQENLASKHKDYRQMETKMAEIWETMSPSERNLVVASPRGLEMLYHTAKSESTEGAIENARKEGANQAYNNKLAKQAASSVPGAASPKTGGALTLEGIKALSPEDHQKRIKEVNAFLENQYSQGKKR